MKLIPSYPIVTERLSIRPLTAADTDDLLAYLSEPEVCRYVPFEPMDRDVIAERLGARWSRTSIHAEGEALTLGVELIETGRVIGDTFFALDSEKHRSAEIGWVFNPRHGGHGYATEAAHAILHLAFDQLALHRVSARADARNGASLRVAERLGMRREAHLLANEWFKGEWSDEVGFALLEHEWEAQHRDGPRSCSWPLAISAD